MSASIDPSRHYVLPEDVPYLRNLAALWAVDPDLARDIEALPDEAAYPIEPSRSGEPTLAVGGPDGRKIYFHSRHRPAEEAARLIESADTRHKLVFAIHGLGLGYHLEQLFDRVTSEALLCVFERDLRLFRSAFEHRDLSRLIESNRILFFTQSYKGDLFTRLHPHLALCTAGIESIIHGPSMQLQQDFHRQAQEHITEFASYCRTTIATLVTNGRRTAENITRNLSWYVATPSLARLKDAFKGEPAIIISAGPSLRKNKHLLKDAQGKAVLIAVQTTLQPMLEMGLEPQFVTSLDYHEICTRFFEKLPPRLSTELIAEPKATSAIFSMYPGQVSLLGNDFAEGLLHEMKLNKTRLPAGATVAHLAYYLAEHLGCDPIIFVGQDLGFSDGLCYAPGTSYEDVWRPELSQFCTVEMKQWEQITRDRRILRRIPDQQGRPMYTEERLFTYLQQFERDFLRTATRIIDATEGGALKRGATAMKLADALRKFCEAPLCGQVPRHAGMDWERIGRCAASLRARREEALRVERIARETLPLLEEVHQYLDDQPRVNRLIGQIDLLRTQMNELGRTYDLITQLTQQTELQRFHVDRSIKASQQSQQERQRMQVARDVENVRAVAEAAAEFVRLMDEAVERLAVHQFRAKAA